MSVKVETMECAGMEINLYGIGVPKPGELLLNMQ
jgi:hypothetical protein